MKMRRKQRQGKLKARLKRKSGEKRAAKGPAATVKGRASKKAAPKE